MRKGSRSGLDLPEGPLWPLMVSVVHAPSQTTVKSEIMVLMLSVLLPEALLMSLSFAALGYYADVSSTCNHLWPCNS